MLSVTLALVATKPLTPAAGSTAICAVVRAAIFAAVSEIVTLSPPGTLSLIPSPSSASACATLNVTPPPAAAMPLMPAAGSAAICADVRAAIFAAVSEIVTWSPPGTVSLIPSPSSASACATLNVTPPPAAAMPLIPAAGSAAICAVVRAAIFAAVSEIVTVSTFGTVTLKLIASNARTCATVSTTLALVDVTPLKPAVARPLICAAVNPSRCAAVSDTIALEPAGGTTEISAASSATACATLSARPVLLATIFATCSDDRLAISVAVKVSIFAAVSTTAIV